MWFGERDLKAVPAALGSLFSPIEARHLAGTTGGGTQSNFLAPSFMGPLGAFRSALLASISCRLSSRFFRASSALLGPAGTKQKIGVSFKSMRRVLLDQVHAGADPQPL